MVEKSIALRVFSRVSFILLVLGLTSCQKYGLALRQQRVDASYLASTHVGSPDPRQKCPPNGQILVVEWWVPPPILKRDPKIVVTMVFRNYTEKVVEFPVSKRISYEVYSVCGEEFEETGGLLTYKAEIVTCDGEIFREWKHQMWVHLIQFPDEQQAP